MMNKSAVAVILVLAFVPAAGSSQDVFDLLRKGDVAAVKALVEKSPQLVEARDGAGMTLLHHAASVGSAELVDFLIDKGAKVDAADTGAGTPLHIAAMRNGTEAAAALLKRGAAVEARDDYQRTPLILCARERGQAAAALVLIEAGADVNAVDKFGDGALDLAAWRGKTDLVDLLLAKGAKLPEPGEKWRGLLAMAASQGLEGLFQRLAGQVQDLKAAAGEGLLRAAAEGGSAAIVGLLLDKGFDPARPDRFGWTPLHYAARDGRSDAARALVGRGAPLDPRTIMGQTAYNVAQERKAAAVAAFLAEKGADTSDIQFPVLKGDYLGQAPPGDTPELFAPGIVSSIWGLHSTAVFSPDGNEVYWAPMMTFPGEIYSRGGLLMMKRVDGRWTAPAWAAFSGPFGNDDVPFFSPDGTRMYFISRRPVPGEAGGRSERIWFTDRRADGWSEPRPLDPNVNSMHMHWEFSLDRERNVYFAGNSPGGLGLNDIYMARFSQGGYEKPVNLGPPVNSSAGEESPFVAPDGSYLLFSRRYDLWVSFRDAAGAWSEPVNLGPGVNSPAVDLCPIVTADGKYLFFLSQRDGESHAYWVRADVIEKARPGRAASPRPLTLTAIANCGVLLASGDAKILIDALFDKPNPDYRAPAPETLEKIMKGEPPFDGVDLVLVTHNHPDHFDAGLGVRYLEARSDAVLLAPADAVDAMRRAAADWAKIESRVVALDLKAGEKAERTVAGIPVTTMRTLHSGDRDDPMNLMFLVGIGGRRVWHEGDSNGKPEVFQAFGLEAGSIDLALVHYWFPLEPNCARWLQEERGPDHIALTHLPIRLEGDAPGKIDMVRQYYKDIALLLPGAAPKIIEPRAGGERSPGSFFGRPAPGVEPAEFLPEVLAAGACPHGQLAFAPDGTGVFWSAIRLEGREQTVYYSAFEGNALSKPAVAPFAAPSGNGGAALSPDGKRLFFSAELAAKDGSSAKQTAIYYVERAENGWSAPAAIESTVDDTMTKGQVSVARNGNIYFSGRVLTERTPGIYRCRYADGRYGPPEKLAGPIADAPLLVDPWIDPEEKFLLISCAPPEGPPMLTDIGISYHRADGTWDLPVRLGGPVNTGAFERFPSLSPDGKYLFFIRSLSPQFVGDQAHFYWVDSSVLLSLGPRR